MIKIIKLSFILFFISIINTYAKDIYLSCESTTKFRTSFIIIQRVNMFYVLYANIFLINLYFIKIFCFHIVIKALIALYKGSNPD